MWLFVSLVSLVSCIRTAPDQRALSRLDDAVENIVDLTLKDKLSSGIQETSHWVPHEPETERLRKRVPQLNTSNGLSTEVLISQLEGIFADKKDRIKHAALAAQFVKILSQRLGTQVWTDAEIEASFKWVAKYSSDVFCIKFLEEYIRVIQTGQTYDGRVHGLVNGATKFARHDTPGQLGKIFAEAQSWLSVYRQALARLTKSPHVGEPVKLEEVKKIFDKHNYTFGTDLNKLLRRSLLTLQEQQKIRDWIVFSINDKDVRDIIDYKDVLRQMPFRFLVALLESLYVKPGLPRKDAEMKFATRLQTALVDYVRQDDNLSVFDLRSALLWAKTYEQPESTFGLPTSESFAHACLLALHDTLRKDHDKLAKAVIGVISPDTEGAWSPMLRISAKLHLDNL
jgi:hypothetical protein